MAVARPAYEFHGGHQLLIAVEAGALTAKSNGNGRIFFDKDRTYRLTAAKDGAFIVESAARDVISFEQVAGRVKGLVLNPGPWAMRATMRVAP